MEAFITSGNSTDVPFVVVGGSGAAVASLASLEGAGGRPVTSPLF